MNPTQTTRPATFTVTDQNRKVVETHTFPAGTKVHVKINRRGQIIARVAGTLFTQHLNVDAVVAPEAS